MLIVESTEVSFDEHVVLEESLFRLLRSQESTNYSDQSCIDLMFEADAAFDSFREAL